MSKHEWITVCIEQPTWRVSSRWFQNAVEFCKRVGGVYDATAQTWDIPKSHPEVQADLALRAGLMNHCLAVVSMNDDAQEMSGDQAMAAYQAGMNEGGDGYNPYWEGASASPGPLQHQPLYSAGLNTAIEQAILAGKNFETARLAPPPTAPGTEWVEILYVPHTLQAGVSWGSDPDWLEAASIDEAYAQFFAQNT